MAMRAMTREIAQCDADIRRTRFDQLAETDPDEYASLGEDIDELLELRLALSEGRARGGRRG